MGTNHSDSEFRMGPIGPNWSKRPAGWRISGWVPYPKDSHLGTPARDSRGGGRPLRTRAKPTPACLSAGRALRRAEHSRRSTAARYASPMNVWSPLRSPASSGRLRRLGTAGRSSSLAAHRHAGPRSALAQTERALALPNQADLNGTKPARSSRQSGKAGAFIIRPMGSRGSDAGNDGRKRENGEIT